MRYRGEVSDKTPAREPLSWSGLLLLLCAGAAGGGEMAWRATELARLGGGAYAILWTLMGLLVAIPLLLVELVLGAEGRARRSTLLALALGTVLLAARLGRLPWLPNGGGALLALAVVGLAVWASGRPRALPGAGGLALGMLAAGPVAVLAGFQGEGGGLASVAAALHPRPAALLHGETWASALVAAMVTLPLLGALGGLAPRGQPLGASRLGLAGVLALGIGLLGAAAMGSIEQHRSVPLGVDGASELGDGLWLHYEVDLITLGVWLGKLGGALGLALALALGARGLAARAGGGERSLAVGVGGVAGALGAAMILAGEEGMVAGGLISIWAVRVGPPLVALTLCWELWRAGDASARCRRIDPVGGLRLHRWLPWAARFALPILCGLALVWALVEGLRAPPDVPISVTLSLPGPLNGALHVVAPVSALVLVVALATGLHWTLGAREEGGER